MKQQRIRFEYYRELLVSIGGVEIIISHLLLRSIGIV